jgi:hypothetical protein
MEVGTVVTFSVQAPARAGAASRSGCRGVDREGKKKRTRGALPGSLPPTGMPSLLRRTQGFILSLPS